MVGDVLVPRRYFACGCGETAAPMDGWAGIGSRSVSEHARRVITLAGSTWSFEQAALKLVALCQLKTSNDTIRAVCDEEGQKAGQWLRADLAPVGKLAAAAGQHEFTTDGTSVNTVDGWREIRLSILSKRESASPATVAQWNDRVLPEPTARLAWCQIANCQKVGARWERMFEHAGVDEDSIVSVIADGAKWIWDQAARRLPKARMQWVVDVYHVSQHIHACGKELFGEGTAQAQTWSQARLEQLIELGGPGFIRALDEQEGQWTAPAHVDAIKRLRGYLAENRDRMWYRQRLAEGRPIGSGQIEGGCKSILGARLKRNSARWRIQRAENMESLRCLQYSDLWDTYWLARAG